MRTSSWPPTRAGTSSAPTDVRPRTRRHRVLLVAVAVAGVLLSSVMAAGLSRYQDERLDALLAQEAQRVESRLQLAMDRAIATTEAVRPLWQVEGDPSRADFADFVAGGVARTAEDGTTTFGGHGSIAFARAVHPGEAPALLAARRAERPGAYRHELDPATPAAMIDYLQPPDLEMLLGVDLMTVAEHRHALEAARDHATPTITPWIDSIVPRPPGDGRPRQLTAVYAPVFAGPVPGTVAQRREAIRGWVIQVIYADDLASRIAADLGVGVELLTAEDGGDSVITRAGTTTGPHVTTTTQVVGRPWIVRVTLDPAALQSWGDVAPWAVLVAGLAATALVVAHLAALQRSEARSVVRAHQAEEDRDRVARSLSVIASQAPIGMALLDADLAVIQTNDRMEALFADAEGAHAFDPRRWVHDADRGRLHDAWERSTRDGDGFEGRFRVRGPDAGDHRWVHMIVSPLDADPGERSAGWVVIADDVTSDVAHERELAGARDEAVRLSRTKSQFLANMSHEIRTPLNGVLGMADLLMSTRLDSVQLERVVTLRTAAWQLMDLLNDILDLSKLEAGRLRIEIVEMSPRSVVDDVVRLHRSKAFDRGVTLDVVAHPDLPGLVRGDPVRLRQIAMNLVGNAVKFTADGSVRVELDGAIGEDGRHLLVLSVVDTGPGIVGEALERIFETFVQADDSTTRRFGGTGLGLPISRQLAEMMGGRIDVVSTPGEGSRFTLTLPVEPVDAPPPVEVGAAPADVGPEPVSTAAGEESGDLQGVRVLLAEDNVINQHVALALLRRLGCEARVVADGLSAVTAVRDGGVDVVLMDGQMPGMDGFEATAHIRALDGPAALVPIVALTASAMRGDRERCLAAGMDDYVTKPVTSDALRAAIVGALATRARPLEPVTR